MSADDGPIKLEHDAPIKLEKPAKLERQKASKDLAPDDGPIKLEAPKARKKNPARAPAMAPKDGKPTKKHQPAPAPAGSAADSLGAAAASARDLAAPALESATEGLKSATKTASTLAKSAATYARKRTRELVTPKAAGRRPRARKTGAAGKAKKDKYVHAKKLRSAKARLLDDGLWVGCLGTLTVAVLVLLAYCRRRCRRKRAAKSGLPLTSTAASPLNKGHKEGRRFSGGGGGGGDALPPAVAAACRSNRADVVEQWLRSCKSPDARSAEPPRRCATHVAATHGAAAVCRALLHAGADPNVADDAGDLPLHLAAAFGSGAVVKILLDHGADPGAPDALGQDAKARAVAKGNTGCALLVSKRLTAESRADGRSATRRTLKMEP